MPINIVTVVDEFLKTRDVSEIFAKVFRYLLRDGKEYFLRHYARPATDVARSCSAYKRAEIKIAPLIKIAANRMQAPVQTLMPEAISEELRKELLLLLITAKEDDIFPVLLCLLDYIDRRCGEIVRIHFDEELTEGVWIRRFDGSRAVSRPLAAFGVRRTLDPRRPPKLLNTDFLLLDGYFSTLMVPPRSTYDKPYPGLLATRSPAIDDLPRLPKIALLSILSNFEDLKINISGEMFSICELERLSVIRTRLKWALERANQSGAEMVVLPELNVESVLVDDIISFMQMPNARIKLAIAGQLHEREASQAGEAEAFRNRPLLLTAGGYYPWPYWKMEPMIYEGLRENLGSGPDYIAAMDFAAGRLGVIVCKDFFTPVIEERLLALQCNLVVVVAMTPSSALDQARAGAQRIAAGAMGVTIFCNSSLHLRRERASGNSERNLVLGFLHPNVKVNTINMPSHLLPEGKSVAVVAVYSPTPEASVWPAPEVFPLVEDIDLSESSLLEQPIGLTSDQVIPPLDRSAG